MKKLIPKFQNSGKFKSSLTLLLEQRQKENE